MAFIIDTDYDMQVRQEILTLLDTSDDSHALKRATDTAISQVKKYLAVNFDIDAIFIDAPEDGEDDERDPFVVTVVIDLLLYHLYSKCPTSKLPEHRSLRYQDAINWLRDTGLGQLKSDLPRVTDDKGENLSDVRIWSKRPSNHKW